MGIMAAAADITDYYWDC